MSNCKRAEYSIENALMDYDAAGGQRIKEFIGTGILWDQYAFLLYQALHIHYVSQPSCISRFRKIPMYINSYFNNGQAGKDVITYFEMAAIKENCKAVDLEYEDFPEIKW